MSRNLPATLKENLEPDPARVAEIAKMLPARPQGLGSPMTDRAAWEGAARQSFTPDLLKAAEEALTEDPPVLTEELYLLYAKTGDRVKYQAALDRRFSRVRLFALGECLENKGRFLPALEKELLDTLEQNTWVLPAHDFENGNYYGKTVTADLSANMNAWSLGTLDYWLGEKLSPELHRHLRAEVRRRVLDPYATTIRTGDSSRGMWWVDVETNWNAVCTSGTVGAALAIVEDPAERAWFLACAEKHLPQFLHGFGPDGYCSEGLGYWNYGWSHYTGLAEAVLEATGGQLNWFNDPQVILVSRYAQRLQITPGMYPAFADCDFNPKPNGALIELLNRRVPGGSGVNALPYKRGKDLLYLTGIALFPQAASSGAGGEVAAELPLRDQFDHAGIFLARPEHLGEHTLAVAFKGGHNGEMHNHNDVGSYVVQVGGVQLLLDPGKEEYTSKTFGPRRYESTVLNSYGHQVPVVGGMLQTVGAQARGKVLATDFTPGLDSCLLDLTSCYEVEALQKLTREFQYSRAGLGKLTVTDHVVFSPPTDFGSALITLAEWKAEGDDTVILARDGQSLRVKINVAGGKLRPIQAEKLPDGEKPARLGLNFAAPVTEATIRLEITPVM